MREALAEKGVLGAQLPAGPSQVPDEPGHEGQRPRDLAQGGLDTFHHCGGGGSDAAAKPRQHAADLAQRRRRHKLVESGSLSDPAAHERD